MDIANIIIAILALIVAIFAIWISVCQANRSDKISLMGLRIDFYNYFCDFINRYKYLTLTQDMLNAKNADIVFGKNNGNQTVSIIISTLGQGQLSIVFKQIIKDLNYLDVNKYLFDEIIISKIDEILEKLKDFKIAFSDCLNNKKTENELQKTLKALGKVFDNNVEDLTDNIKKIVSVKYKN